MSGAAGEKARDAASKFLLNGICDFGQTDKLRAQATADYLRSAGFDVEPSGFPVFGGMFPQQKITGPQGEAAHAWLSSILNERLQRGECNSEIRQLTKFVQEQAEVSHAG